MPVLGLTTNSIKRAFEAQSPIHAVGNYDKKFITLILQFLAFLGGGVGGFAMEGFWHINSNAKKTEFINLTNDLLEQLLTCRNSDTQISTPVGKGVFLRLQQIQDNGNIKVRADFTNANGGIIERSEINTSLKEMANKLHSDVTDNPTKYEELSLKVRKLVYKRIRPYE